MPSNKNKTAEKQTTSRMSRLNLTPMKVFLWSLLLAFIVLVAYRTYQSVTKASRSKPTPVTQLQLKPTEILTVSSDGFEKSMPISGSLNPYTQTTVRPRASGQVAEVKVRAGQAVTKGQVLARLVDTNYQAQRDQAQANALSAKTALDIAEKDYQNNVALKNQGFISDMALQKVAGSLASARAQYTNASRALVIADKALTEATVVAPISGFVASSTVQTGDTVGSDTAMFTIVDISRFELVVPVSAEQIGQIQVGQTVTLNSAGVDQSFTGQVERVNPAAQNGSRSYSAYITVDNPTGLLKAGMFAEGKLVVSHDAKALAIPAAAIHQDNGVSYVYKIADNKLVKQTVEVGARASDAVDAPVEIKSGLGLGDQVVRLDMGVLKEGVDVVIANDPAKNTAAAEAKIP